MPRPDRSPDTRHPESLLTRPGTSSIPAGCKPEIIDAMEATQCTPSLSQSIRIKKLSEAGKLTESEAEGILGEIKQKEADRVVFKNEQLYTSHTIAVEIG